MVSVNNFQEAAAQPAGHPLKAVPIAVAEEEGSESEEDELKPRGTPSLLSALLLPSAVCMKLFKSD